MGMDKDVICPETILSSHSLLESSDENTLSLENIPLEHELSMISYLVFSVAQKVQQTTFYQGIYLKENIIVS